MLGRKHILQLVHSLAVGGTERVVCRVADAFNDGEFRTSVCCLDELGAFGKELQSKGVAVYVLDRKPGFDSSLVSRLRGLYTDLGVDIVHTPTNTRLIFTVQPRLYVPV